MLFEQLENLGFVYGTEVNDERVDGATATEIVELAAESAELTSASALSREVSPFTHSASISLGGGTGACSSLSCRSERVEQLSQFAALYSDRVYIHNFLTEYSAHPHTATEAGLELARSHLKDDLRIFAALRPLIEAGRIVPATAPKSWCPDCFGVKAKGIIGQAAMGGLARAGERLRQRFLQEAAVFVERHPHWYALRVQAPEDLIEHGEHAAAIVDLAYLKDLPEVRARLVREKIVRLSRKQVEKLGTHKAEASEILKNVLFELTISETIGTSFLTERPIHIDILRDIASETKQEQRNSIIHRHLTALLPFVGNISAEDLLRLRSDEGDSFLLFRQALNQAVDEVRKDGNSQFTERDAKQIYGDFIEPNLARLDVKLRNAQRTMAKQTGRKLAAWTGAISFGLFSGIVSSALIPAAKALGLTKIAADLAESSLGNLGNDDSIKDDSLYFLWRVRNLGGKRGHG